MGMAVKRPQNDFRSKTFGTILGQLISPATNFHKVTLTTITTNTTARATANAEVHFNESGRQKCISVDIVITFKFSHPTGNIYYGIKRDFRLKNHIPRCRNETSGSRITAVTVKSTNKRSFHQAGPPAHSSSTPVKCCPAPEVDPDSTSPGTKQRKKILNLVVA